MEKFDFEKLQALYNEGKISRATFFRCKAEKRMPNLRYHQPKVRNKKTKEEIFDFFLKNEGKIKGYIFKLLREWDADYSLIDDLFQDVVISMVDRGEVSFALIGSKVKDFIRGRDIYRNFVKWRYQATYYDDPFEYYKERGE